MTQTLALYPTLDANPNFAAIESEILEFWRENNVFAQSVSNRPARKADGSSNAYVFYDGPPFANGLPHYGHLLTGYVKDAIARYHTMAGSRVERRFGWDCHGLPAEMGAEKDLGISGRAAITHYGIGNFNEHCRTSVMKYTQDWEYYVTRQGRWVDFKNDYKTMDTPFMESCVWAFSELYKKGLIYESMRVMPYSWAAETPVSNFETRIDNATREREDKAAFVKFKLKEVPQFITQKWPAAQECVMIAWTTTPWTLPSNLALAISKKVTYWVALREATNTTYILSPEAYLKLHKDLQLEHPIDVIRPSTETDRSSSVIILDSEDRVQQLLNLPYEPLFPYFKSTEGAFRVLDGSDFVTDGDGTGIVHMAPGFGEVDQACCAKNGIEVIVPVDEKGRFTDAIVDIPWITPPTVEESSNDASCSRSPLVGEPHPSSDVVGGKKDPRLIEYAREMRKEATPWETKLWARLKNDQLGGYKFRRQQPMAPYILDFVNYEKRLIVELDGSQHADSAYDQARDAHFKAQGFTVLRFWNNEVDSNLEGICERILDCLEKAPHRDPQADLDSPTRGECAFGAVLSLAGLTVVADTRIAEADIVVAEEDKAQHIAAKDVAKYGLANMRIVRWLKANNKLVKDEPCKHNYPHCWRTDTPLIYRAMSSWYVNVQAIKANMAANNETIHWIPDHVQQGQMGKGIESAPDWSISRNRFWGTPIPIWKAPSGKIIVPSSIAEIEKLSGKQVKDLHRPYIDEITFERDGETYTRIEDVFDCWFESGSMPFAQLHYPFENKETFEESFPADFITEYIAQTRGWFYTLQVLSAALFGKAPFKNCICHGVVIDEETGLKYSKRLKNYKDPKEVMDAYGADALRWMMLASPVMRGSDLGVDPEGKFIRDVVRLTIKPLWSAYNFFCLYANADGVRAELVARGQRPEASNNASLATGDWRLETNLLDRYILAKCRATVEAVRAGFEAYDTPSATDAITAFFDVLNNWYIRRSRARFWGTEMTADKQAAYDTLYTVLTLMCRAAAPLLPFTTEAVYRGLVGTDHSVHLTDFPDVSGIAEEKELIADMDKVRDACTAMGSIRNTENIRNRQPLACATLYGAGADRLRPYAALMEDELNVKEIRFANSLEGVAQFTLTINFPVAGKRLGAKMKAVGAAAKAGDWTRAGDQIVVGGEPMEAGEYTLQLKSLVAKGAQALSGNDALVVLDLHITPELEAEGRARDLVRMIQQARKDAGLNVGDRIALALDVPAPFEAALAAHGAYIAEQVLAVSIGTGAGSAAQCITQELDGERFTIGLTKAA